jgi:integration host factor subunit alpha
VGRVLDAFVGGSVESKPRTVIRVELADSLAKAFEVRRFQADEFLETMLEEIGESLANGRNVKLPGFGTFRLLTKESRVGRNPKTLKETEIKARNIVSFHCSLKLKERLNEKR